MIFIGTLIWNTSIKSNYPAIVSVSRRCWCLILFFKTSPTTKIYKTNVR